MKRIHRIHIITALLAALAVLSGAGAYVRNRVYETDLTLWRDCAEKNEWRDMRTMVAYVGALKKKGEFGKAGEMLEKARQLEWDRGRFSMENIKFLVNQYVDYFPLRIQIVLHEFLLDLDPDDHRSYEFIASSYMLRGDMENARIAVSFMNRTFLHDAARAFMGDIYSYYGCYEKAEREYMKAVAKEARHPLWRVRLLQNSAGFRSIAEMKKLFDMHGKYLEPEHASVFTEFLYGNIPDDPVFLVPVAELAYKNGDYTRTGLCLDRLILETEKLPSEERADALLQAAGIYSNMKEYERVYSLLADADTADFPLDRQADIFLIMARICRELGKHSESGAWYEKTLEHIDDPDIQYIVRRKMGISRKAQDNGI